MRRISPVDALPSQFSAECLVAESVGSFVYISGESAGGLPIVRACHTHYDTQMPSAGVIVSKPASDRCEVVSAGEVSGLWAGLEVGRTYLVGIDGGIQRYVEAAGPNGYSVVQHVGIAMRADSLLVALSTHIGIRRT